MPVLHRVLGGILAVTVDGDFTAEEVGRVGDRALKDPDLILPAFVLLDLTGASGLQQGSLERLDPVAAYFAGPKAPVARLAVVAGAEAAEAMVAAARASGLECHAFKSKADATQWLFGE